jgi:adenylate cyclase
MHCGAGLSSRPPPAAPGSYTPEHLRERVLTTRSAVEGERKQVTVLFLDIKDSVALSSRLGADQWHEVLERFFRALSAQVHQHEGTINQYTGDGIMALWGAPLANEHHADRACRAALAIRDAVVALAPDLQATYGVALQIRIGINSGEVVVGRIGDDMRSDYTAQGQTVGLASRMESSCEPGQIVLTEHTAALLPPGFELQALGEIAPKGAAKVRAYALSGLIEGRPSAVLRDRRVGGVFLGRGQEIARFDAALAQAAHGRGHVIGVSGDAGIGKTRLCSELLARCAALGIATHATRCASHERHRPLSSLLPLLRSFFGLKGGDPPEADRAAIGKTLGQRLHEVLPLVWAALEIGDGSAQQPTMDPEARRRRLHGALAEAFEHAPHAALFIDDAHWIDPASDDLLATLVEALARSRMLLVLNFRPEYGAPWMQGEDYTPLRLSPLGKSEIELLLAHLAGRDASLRDLAAMVHDRASGNPLFVEETLRSLVESQALVGAPGAYRLQRPVAELSVPATVQSILAARIDRLGDGPKHLLQTAATAGTEFTIDLLAAVDDAPEAAVMDGIVALERAEFVQIAPEVTGGGAAAPALRYAFRHPLVREVAYGSLLVQRRKALHARIASVLLHDTERSRTLEAAIVAHHFECADEPVQAAEYYRLAANHAGYAHTEQSYTYWQKAAELASKRPELNTANRHELAARMQMLNLGWRRGIDGPAAEALFSRSLELIERVGHDGWRATLHAGYGRALSAISGADTYLDHARAAVRFARKTGDGALIASMSVVYAQALCRSGQLEAGVGACDEALRAAPAAEAPQRNRGLDFSFTTWVLLTRGQALSLLGRLPAAQQDIDACLRAADARGEVDLLVAPRQIAVELARYRGELSGVQVLAHEAMEAAEKFGSSLSRVHAHLAQGLAMVATGEAVQAEQALLRGIAIAADRLAGMECMPRMHRLLSEALLLQDRVADARSAASAAVEHARARETRGEEAQALIALARARMRESDDEAASEATGLLEHAERMAKETAVRVALPEVALARAELAARRNAEPERLAALAEAEELLAAMGAPVRVAKIREMMLLPRAEQARR